MLAPDPHVPDLVVGELIGEHGSRAYVMAHDDAPRADLWLVTGDKQLAGVHLDAAGWLALQQMAGEVVRRLRPVPWWRRRGP